MMKNLQEFDEVPRWADTRIPDNDRGSNTRRYLKAKNHKRPYTHGTNQPTGLRILAHFLSWLMFIINDLWIVGDEDDRIGEHIRFAEGMEHLERGVWCLKQVWLDVMARDLVHVMRKLGYEIGKTKTNYCNRR
jgi:hypothetical protein